MPALSCIYLYLATFDILLAEQTHLYLSKTTCIFEKGEPDSPESFFFGGEGD